MNELFRFVQLRAAQTADIDDLYLVRAWSSPRTALHEQVASASSGSVAASAARAFLEDLSHDDGRRRLTALSAKLGSGVAGLRKAVEDIFGDDELLNADRSLAGDQLCANALLPDTDLDALTTAQQWLIAAAIAQRARRSDTRLTDATLPEVLSLAVMLLPPDVFPPGVFHADGVLPAGEGAGAAPDGITVLGVPGGVIGGDPPHIDVDFEARRRQALGELGNLIRTPDAGIEVSEMVIPVPDSDVNAPEVAPRLRTVGEPVGAAALVLTDERRAGLSPSTLDLIDMLAPGRPNLLEIASLVERATAPQSAVAQALRASDPTGGFLTGYGALRPPVEGLIRPPGVGELLVVRQEHMAYRLGAIAHIENVLAGEELERTHRRLNRTEELTQVVSERIEVEERDLQTNERFELVTETERDLEEQRRMQLGVTVSGSYGPVTATASFGYTSGTTRSESDLRAITSARETVDRAVKKLTERTQRMRQVLTVREVEEINRHKLANETDDHSAGIYRWVDDEQSCGVYNYGTRLMIEGHVPEPGAWLAWAEMPATSATQPPEPPRLPGEIQLIDPSQLKPSNYQSVAGAVGASVEPPPEQFVTVGLTLEQTFTGNTPGASTPAFLFYKADKTLVVPDGYRAVRAKGNLQADAWAFDCHLSIGPTHIQGSTQQPPIPAMPLRIDVGMGAETGDVPFALTIHNGWGYALALMLICERTDREMEKWQLTTFTSIQQAYQARLSEWEEERRAAEIVSGGAIRGRNPQANRQIERTELKRHMIGLLSGSRLDRFGAIAELSPYGEPFPEASAAVGQGAVVSFYEQAFEWEQMTYLLYPYVWGRHEMWQAGFVREDDPDPLHQAFRTCGVARVVVPVRPGFEMTALYFLATGRIWPTGKPPQIGDPLYVSIAAELIAAAKADKSGVLVGAEWPILTPTTLVYLQADAELNPGP